MAANHKSAHVSNVRERRAARLAKEPSKPEVEAVAQSEPQASDSAEAETEGLDEVEEVSVGPRTSHFESPMTYGEIDQ